uniref:Uncharacterized protein n=1 Tax=Davidia involucrata TaxID=16924 RepID=A0A5B7B4U7_DAVIN
MNLLRLHCTPPSHSLPHFSSTFKSKTPMIKTTRVSVSVSATTIPARDRVIEFGKHKGKMLGTLPSNYLKWVSKNLRARDFEEWAKLADRVLEDPVYRDRIEWELAEKVLNGDISSSSVLSRSDGGAVSELLEISERFGWDNEDKVGWRRINFALLGTSKGGRIPRLLSDSSGLERDLRLKRGNNRACGGGGGEVARGGERRRERRERIRLKRSGGGGSQLGLTEKMTRLGVGEKGRDAFDDDDDDDDDDDGVSFESNQENHNDWMVENHSPFPGREALLKKVLKAKGNRL